MLLTTLTAIAAASAATIPSAGTGEGVLHLPVNRRNVLPQNTLENFEKRADDDVNIALANNVTFYSIDFELGTPPQPISLLLDTGSSDLWVFDQSACAALGQHCPLVSVFDSNRSSTFQNNHTRFVQEYADQSMAIGTWGQDVMNIGGRNISNLNFAIAEETNSTQATAGIGLAVGETPYILGDIKKPYLNLPEQLKEQGVIQRVAYSLWLNTLDSKAGTVLFGGIDHAKYSSNLYTMPLVETEGLPMVTRFAVQMTGMSIYDSHGNEQPFASCNAPVVLDSGSTISSMPSELIEPFFDLINAEEYRDGMYLIDCGILSSSDGGLGLQIGGIDITVGFSDLFVKVGTARLSGTSYCVPGFLISDVLPIIGDNILRTLYVVYDLENLEVGIAAAQSGNAASSSSIEALSTGIPGTRAANVTQSRRGTAYATTSITLFGSSTSKAASSHPSIDVPSEPRAESTGSKPFTGVGNPSMTVPSTVGETIVIGAKTTAGKAGNSNPTQTSSSSSKSKSKSKNGAAVAGTSSLALAFFGAIFSLL